MTKNAGVPRAPSAPPWGLLLLDLLLDGLVLHVGLESVDVELKFASPLLEVLIGERPSVVEQLVVHLPELALLASGFGSDGCRERAIVHGQRVVLERDSDLVAVDLLDLRHRRVDPFAERTLEVGPLDDGDEGVAGPLHGRVVHRDLVRGVRVGAARLWTTRGGLFRRSGRRKLVDGLLDDLEFGHDVSLVLFDPRQDLLLLRECTLSLTGRKAKSQHQGERGGDTSCLHGQSGQRDRRRSHIAARRRFSGSMLWCPLHRPTASRRASRRSNPRARCQP